MSMIYLVLLTISKFLKDIIPKRIFILVANEFQACFRLIDRHGEHLEICIAGKILVGATKLQFFSTFFFSH